MDLIEELSWRGMIQDIIPGTKELLNKEMVSGYVGFDPTADSLHIGSLVPILLLMHLQKAGHKPFALVGGATGMVGDPSGKSEERNLLDETTLQHNQECIHKQLVQFLDFNPSLPNSAVIVNNYDWFKNISFLSFIRDVGKHITVNYMMAKDSVRKRIEGENGMSFTEFSYQLVQGFDFYWLHQHHNCKLQMGGSDQWGNIITGTELIRKKAGGEAFAFTCPLITKADGGKFGKTEKGNVWLEASKTSPYLFYQFWLNASDEDAEKWIKLFTFLKKDEIEAIIEQQKHNPGNRTLQKRLAEEVTTLVHGPSGLQQAVETTAKLFSNAAVSAEELTTDDLENMEGIVKFEFSAADLENGIDIVSFLAQLTVFPSKGEARKTIQGGGISINRKRIDSIQQLINNDFLLHDKYILIQKGKKNYYLVQVA